MLVTWNLTRKRAALCDADMLVISAGKSGRTWLRILLNKYLSLHYSVPFSIENLHKHSPAIPSIVYRHWFWSHIRDASWLKRVLGHFIIPRRILWEKKVVLLTRDPRDGIASAYFQASKRRRARHRSWLSIKDYIRDPRQGIGSAVRALNLFHQHLERHPYCLVLTYESIKSDPSAQLQRLLRFIGIEPNAEHVAVAVAFASFDNMKRMEQSHQFHERLLQPGNLADADSFKVRKGKVSGYREYFDADDLAYLEQHVAALHPDFGYGEPPPPAREQANGAA